ncbi:carbohydrate ABC transporter permease [Couchioplanes caeruleus]|uniref:Sugar ABC transporter permease n=2 Tax=Couchioplanes caeruleus TaxID=56438 RepID=A0A1K0H073_9ACTN|nr:sugar ABC transporter permease [Couchioplanes caeruleus]OJF15083.1 sugar ABC transporter permease [Couchioplanes caeruleus subsp. caeruleus]ROP33952.1 carbohydrate ABC transporter membrane protein 1 (CUT1 family) [Couchioplanes caeruleus]
MRLRRNLTALSFLAPALAGIVVFFLYPLLSAAWFSFTRFDLLTAPQWVGLANYRRMAEDPYLWQSIRNTLWMVVVFVPVRIVSAIGLSMLLSRLRRGAGFFRTIFYLPALAPPVAATIAFVYLLKPGTGPVNAFLARLGIEGPLWFNSPDWSKPSLVLLGLWGIGDLMIIFLAAVLGVPASLYEAAALDGANAWHRFRYVTLPTIRPVILFAAVTGVIYTLQYFDQAAVAGSIASGQAVTGGGISSSFGFPEGSTFTYPLWLYTVGFRYHALGYANAMAIALFLVAFAVTVILLRRSRAFSGEEQ